MKRLFVFLASLFAICAVSAFAQALQTPEEREKALFDGIDKEIERQTSALDLADWQIFRIDSTLVHDYKGMTADFEELRKAKVASSAAYTAVQDKWNEAIYNSYHNILNEEQWDKYLKSGAARNKKLRDKRAEKGVVSDAKLKEKQK